jgi:hypothetical protein
MSAKDCVPAGGSLQDKAGEIFRPVQAYFAGIDCPFMNASLVKVRDMVVSEAGISVDGEDVAVAAVVHDVMRIAGKKSTRPKRVICLMTSLLF